ncbi:MAG TPA: hypothetical protein ACQGQH_09715 [Xylella sp.]
MGWREVRERYHAAGGAGRQAREAVVGHPCLQIGAAGRGRPCRRQQLQDQPLQPEGHGAGGFDHPPQDAPNGQIDQHFAGAALDRGDLFAHEDGEVLDLEIAHNSFPVS